MQFANLALGQSDEVDVGVPQSLVNRSDILLIATDPIERLGNNDVKRATFRLSGAASAGPCLRVVAKCSQYSPAQLVWMVYPNRTWPL